MSTTRTIYPACQTLASNASLWYNEENEKPHRSGAVTERCNQQQFSTDTTPFIVLKKGIVLMDSIPCCPQNGNSNEDNTPHYKNKQPVWLDGNIEAQFIKYNAKTVKIYVFTTMYERTITYTKNVAISRISPRAISDGKEVGK